MSNIIVACLVILAFWYGRRTSDNYYEHIISQYQFLFRQQGLNYGVGYAPPPQPISSDFIHKLRTEGRAIQALRKS